uniref:Calmodulin n=1 Tax=Pyrodinium bahamense TaxID=73915 RepID=A0A7S0ASE5_9DINO|mmetsp:Transcript_40770/g.113330  ORF Transcript_40770/g.113330 Transcript_40770/m.113330 type:complete len:796 (+) Transcript_40770:109-2496(+)
MSRRPRSASSIRGRDEARGGGSYGFVHSGPGHAREFPLLSKFIAQDPLKHGSAGEPSFTTVDFSKFNGEVHNWQRIDTFQTPSSGGDSLIRDMEEVPPRRGQCALRSDLLAHFRDEILEGCRADLQSVVTLVRQDVDRSTRQILSQVRRCVHDQNADSLHLLSELSRARSCECDLTEVLKEVQGSRGGESREHFQQLQALNASIEAALEGVKGMSTGMSTLVTRQGNVEEGVAEFRREMQRVRTEVAEIRRVRTELEFRNARQKKCEAEVADVLNELRELRASLAAQGPANRTMPVASVSGDIHCDLHLTNAKVFEEHVTNALHRSGHATTICEEIRKELQESMTVLDLSSRTVVDGAMERVVSAVRKELDRLLREVRGIKADVDLKIIREGTRDVKVFVSSVQSEEADTDVPTTPPRRKGQSPLLRHPTGEAAVRSPWSLASASTSASSPQASLTGEDFAALSAVFQRADVNHNGAISVIEAIKALDTDERFARVLGFPGTFRVRQEDGTREAFLRAFQRLDADDNTCITWQEMIAFAECQRVNSRPTPTKAGRAEPESLPPVVHPHAEVRPASAGRGKDKASLAEQDLTVLQAVFQRVDVSGGGTISMIEAIKALEADEDFAHALGFPSTFRVRQEDGTREAFLSAFRSVDADGNASISWPELVAFAERQHSDGARAAAHTGLASLSADDQAFLRNVFDRIDANRSGGISMGELKKAICSDENFACMLGFDGCVPLVRWEDGTRDAFCRVFQQVDADGDKSITWEELLVFAAGLRGELARVGELEDWKPSSEL